MTPEWLKPLVDAVQHLSAEQFSRFTPPQDATLRESAVLILFGDDLEHGPDVLLIERSRSLRNHSGQAAFPGGALDAADNGPAAAAIREAAEETGLDPVGIEVLAQLPQLWVPVSGFAVTPVIGYWRSPSPVFVADPAEVAAVERVPLSELVSADNRVRLRHPSGHVGPGFLVRGLTVWGFTGGLLARLITFAGWEQPWDTSRVLDLESH